MMPTGSVARASEPASPSAGIKKINLEGKEARANAARDRLGAGAHAELREHRGQMVFHRMRGEIELSRNFLVAQPLRDEAQHIQLARREGDAFLGRGSRCRGRDHPLAHHHIGLFGLVHEHDLRIGLDERRQPASRHRVGEVEVDAQLHMRPERNRSTSGTGTASATPDTTIAGTPAPAACTTAISRSASRRTTSPGTARPSGVTIVALEPVTTCALVTNRSPDHAMPAPPAAPRPRPPLAIPTTLARSRSAGSLRNAALMVVIALCVAARR